MDLSYAPQSVKESMDARDEAAAMKCVQVSGGRPGNVCTQREVQAGGGGPKSPVPALPVQSPGTAGFCCFNLIAPSTPSPDAKQMFDCDGDRRDYAKKQWADFVARDGVPQRKAAAVTASTQQTAEPAESGQAE